jgi:hypothetical protein
MKAILTIMESPDGKTCNAALQFEPPLNPDAPETQVSHAAMIAINALADAANPETVSRGSIMVDLTPAPPPPNKLLVALELLDHRVTDLLPLFSTTSELLDQYQKEIMLLMEAHTLSAHAIIEAYGGDPLSNDDTDEL